jgi:hypothetical protein
MSESCTTRRYFLGIFRQEDHVVAAVKILRAQGIPVSDVFTPYAVHGLDEAMGIKRSRLPLVCFFAGLAGFILAMGFQSWVFTTAWPMNIGGKPHFAFPAFIPVGFEVTVLMGGLLTVLAFLLRSKLFPGNSPHLIDSRVTDGSFVLALEIKDASLDQKLAGKILAECGAVEICDREVAA